MADDKVIGIEHVTKRFGGFVAVDDAHFDITRGEFFSLLGPSGCGKTTTLRMIAGFEQPTSGRITLEGKDVSRVPPYKRNVNTVFQHYALFPHMTVFDNVAFGPRSRRVARAEVTERVQEILRVVRLDHLAARKPGQLSGGQQQRVALARALVNYPSALLLDEPLGALDLKLRRAMQLELKRIQREVGITFVYVTHDQEEALTMSDRIAVMDDGRVEQIGTPEDVYERPSSVFVAGFIGVANLIPVKVESTNGETATVILPDDARAPARADGSNLASGGRASLMLRPERIRLSSAEPPAGAVRLATSVHQLTFQGPVVRAELHAADGSEVVAHIGPDDELPALRPGDRVWLTWDDDAARVLPAADPRMSGTQGEIQELEQVHFARSDA